MKPRYARSELRFLLGHRHTGEPYQGPPIEGGNADTVDNIHASTYPVPNQLLALDSNAKFPVEVLPEVSSKIFLSPEYPNCVHTHDGEGVGPSGNNSGTLSYDKDLEGNTHRNYARWLASSGVATLQDTYLCIEFQIPEDFVSFESTAISLEYQTEVTDATKCKVDILIYKSGTGFVTSVLGLSSSTWETAIISGTALGTWNAGEKMIILLKLYSGP